MAVFQLTSLVVTLYEPERIPADFLGLKGYNIYHATLPLHYTDIPICVAHRTLKRKCSAGTVARVRGSCTVAGRTLLVTASTLIPAAIEPVRADIERPRSFHCLPRVLLAGTISSRVSRLTTNNECMFFDITIDRPDVYPGVPFTISCWIHRDQKRFSLLEELSADIPVIITGVGCGWTWDDKLMIDVYSIAYNNEGPPPPVRATDPPNPFARAIFRDGFPIFPLMRHAETARRSLLCMGAPPTVAAVPRVQQDRSRDPRLQGVNNKFQALQSADATGAAPAPVVATQPVPQATSLTGSVTSAAEVRHAARKDAGLRMRSRVSPRRRSPCGSSTNVPLKLKISAKQIATLS